MKLSMIFFALATLIGTQARTFNAAVTSPQTADALLKSALSTRSEMLSDISTRDLVDELESRLTRRNGLIKTLAATAVEHTANRMTSRLRGGSHGGAVGAEAEVPATEG